MGPIVSYIECCLQEEEEKKKKKTASVHQTKGVRYTLVKSPFTANPNLKPQNGALWCSRSAAAALQRQKI